MFIQGNLLGFFMVIASALVVLIGTFVLKWPNVVVMITVGLALILMDFALRSRNRQTKSWLMDKQFGGYLYFMPVWTFGMVMILVNVINIFIPSNPR